MANRKTRRRNKKDQKHLGYAVVSANGGKFRPKLSAEQQELVQEIRKQTFEMYGRYS